MKKLVAVFAVLVVACLAWLFSRAIGSASDASREAAATTSATATPLEVAATRPATAQSPAEIIRSEITPTGSRRSNNEILVRVLDARTLAPVEGAEVYTICLDWRALAPDERALWNRDTDLEPRLRERGRRAVTDVHGEARVARTSSWFRACARAGDRYGEDVSNNAGRDEVVIEIDADLRAVARVRDAAGEPQGGIKVDLTLHPKDPRAPHAFMRRETAKDTGLAVFAHVQTSLRRAHPNRPSGAASDRP